MTNETETTKQESCAEAGGQVERVVVADWILNPRNNPPPEGVLVEVRGSDRLGEWRGHAVRKDYKPDSLHRRKRKWRWCNQEGKIFEDQDIEAWRYISHNAALTGAPEE